MKISLTSPVILFLMSMLFFSIPFVTIAEVVDTKTASNVLFVWVQASTDTHTIVNQPATNSNLAYFPFFTKMRDIIGLE